MPRSNKILSPLKLEDFQVLKSAYNFIPPKEEEVNLNKQELFEQYEIDIDYSIQERNDKFILIFMKCGVNFNQDKPKMGYELFTEIVNVYDISQLKENINEDSTKKIVVFSGLGIAINNIRNYLYNITNQGPFKEYLLPAIDVQSIIEIKNQKADKVKKQQEKKTKKKS